MIARDWNVRASGKGFLTRFRVAKRFPANDPVQKPAEGSPAFNAALVGKIEVIAEYP